MKKILLLICIFLASCDDEIPNEGLVYEKLNSSIGNHYISLDINYELPQYRIDDFLGTILLFLTEPELKGFWSIRIGYEDGGNFFTAGFGLHGSQAIVDNNSNYNSSITDPKDVKYYTTIIIFNDRSLAGINITLRIYLRQDLDSTTISYMIMIKPYETSPYEYIGHTVLNQMFILSTYGEREPLPDILK